MLFRSMQQEENIQNSEFADKMLNIPFITDQSEFISTPRKTNKILKQLNKNFDEDDDFYGGRNQKRAKKRDRKGKFLGSENNQPLNTRTKLIVDPALFQKERLCRKGRKNSAASRVSKVDSFRSSSSDLELGLRK